MSLSMCALDLICFTNLQVSSQCNASNSHSRFASFPAVPPTTVAKQQTIELFDTAVCKLLPQISLFLCQQNQCRIFSLL